MADVGTIGERQFSLWCEQGDLTANPATQDRYGWDFVVQFPHLDMTAPLDVRAAQCKCMVQVKSTAVGSHRAGIKLDNWERMINDPLPWFVCAMAVDGAAVTEVYLVHIDQRHTERVLERLRSLRATDPSAVQRLHEYTLDVSWGEGDRVLSATGVGVREALLGHMGTDPYKYVQQKLEWYKSAGYDEHPRLITANITGRSQDEFWKKVTDFSLGLSRTLPIYLEKVVDRRFGIPVTEIDMTGAREETKLGHLGDHPPSVDEPVTVAITNGKQNSMTTFRCAVYHSAAFIPKVPQKYQRLRFASPVFELLMDAPPKKRPKRLPYSFNVQFRFPPLSTPDVAVPLASLAKIGRVLRYLIDAPEKGLRVQLNYTNKTWALPEQRGSAGLPQQSVVMCEVLEKCAAITSMFEMDMDLLVAPNSVFAQQEQIRLLWGALRRQDMYFPISVPIGSDGAVLNDQKIAILTAASIRLGDRRLVSAFAVCGAAHFVSPTENDVAWIQIREGEVQVLWNEVVGAVDWSSEGLFVRLQGKAMSMMKEDGFSWASYPSPMALDRLV